MFSLIDKDDDIFTRNVKYVSVVLLPLLVLYMIYAGLNQFSDYEEILVNKAFTKGVIVNMKYASVSTDKIIYEYEIAGVKYQQSTEMGYAIPCKGRSGNYSSCIGRVYTVIYSSLNPEKSDILINARSYEIYNLKVPKEFE
ncbi:MAG: hypothetical protein K0B10_14985 [Vicingaceae bacterium]|nr:hypothetical protein [Vicingaceae bacterium]